MEKKIKRNSNTDLEHIKIHNYPVYPILKFNIKNIFEHKPRKNSVFQIKKSSKHLSRFRNITQDQVIKILNKDKKLRIDIENRLVADYLTEHFDYFEQIKESSSERFLKLISVLDLEIISSNTIIINVNEENNNFYVLFEGQVIVYRKYNYKKDMTFQEFCEYLHKAKLKNKEEYKRILNNNTHLDLNFEDIMRDEYYYLSLKNKIFNFNIEELEEIGTFSEGYSFGELSLINKRNKDIIIKSITNCKLISVSKFDFNRILRTIEEKRIEKKAYIFKKNFPIFNIWSMEQLITLFNYCTQEIFNNEEFIYKQNDESEYIYFVEDGTIVQYTNISFSWYLQFIEYIKNMNNNLLETIKNLNIHNSIINPNSGELHKIMNKIIKKKKYENYNNNNYQKYPFFNIDNIYMKRKKDLIKINELYYKEKKIDNFFQIKYEENDINNPEKIYKIPIITTENPCILGLEEIFQLKKRFSSVGCISGQVRVKKIKIIDLLTILYYYREYDYIETFFDFVLQKKKILCETIKTHLQKIGNNFEIIMKDKYDKIITQPTIFPYRNIKSNSLNNKKNEVLVATKLKTWDNGLYLDNVLDTSLHLLKAKSTRQIKLEKKEKYKKLNNLFKIKSTSNEKTFLKTKNFFSKILLKKPLCLGKNNKKIKLKCFKKDNNNKKERFIDNFFNTSIFPKKKNNKSRNIKSIFEEKKNSEYIYMKTYDNNIINSNKLLSADKPFNLKIIGNKNDKNILNRPLKKLINYKVSEDYFDNNKDNEINNDNIYIKDINPLSYFTKEKETENHLSGASTNDKEKEKKKTSNLNKDLIKTNLNRNIYE